MKHLSNLTIVDDAVLAWHAPVIYVECGIPVNV